MKVWTYWNTSCLRMELEKVCQILPHEELRQAGRLEGEVSIELHHMITSAYFTAVFETVVHDMERDKAKRYVAELAQFFNSSSYRLDIDQ